MRATTSPEERQYFHLLVLITVIIWTECVLHVVSCNKVIGVQNVSYSFYGLMAFGESH